MHETEVTSNTHHKTNSHTHKLHYLDYDPLPEFPPIHLTFGALGGAVG